eukprot:COSAG02_NODE_24525_length_685_cov_1.639932_2_plen_83_part_00
MNQCGSQCCITVRKSPRSHAAIGLQLLRKRTGPGDRRLGTKQWYCTHGHGLVSSPEPQGSEGTQARSRGPRARSPLAVNYGA